MTDEPGDRVGERHVERSRVVARRERPGVAAVREELGGDAAVAPTLGGPFVDRDDEIRRPPQTLVSGRETISGSTPVRCCTYWVVLPPVDPMALAQVAVHVDVEPRRHDRTHVTAEP